MSMLKKAGNRLIYFIVGLVLTAGGAVLIYINFKAVQRSPNTNSWTSFPFILLVIGICCIILAFSKKIGSTANKKEEQAQPEVVNTAGDQAGQTPGP